MAMNDRNGRLACGTQVGVLADQVAEHASPIDPRHQADCPHCRAALGELEQLWGDVRELAREEVEIPGGLVTAVLRRVRREREEHAGPSLPLEQVVPRLVRHALLRGSRGHTQIADSVIAKLIRHTVLATPGVGSLARGSEGLSVSVEQDEVGVRIGLVVDLSVAIPPLVQALRVRVEREIEGIAGLRLSTFDVSVIDVSET